MRDNSMKKIGIIGLVTAATLGIHYGWIIEPIFGHVHWIHSIHGRFCYIPIVIGAAWFGLRGGFLTATAISLLVLPLIFSSSPGSVDVVKESAEIVFYYALAILTGLLVDREFAARKKQHQAQQHLEQSQKLSIVGELAAGVAHEIKNPLASIKGAADILTDRNTSEEARDEFGELLQREVRRIDDTVTDFLTFARPREAVMAPLNLADVLQRAVRQLEPQASGDNITLSLECDSDLPVRGDSEKLHQTILNLILNAVQASSSDQVITIRGSVTGSNVTMAVIDNGAGIPEADLTRIFEPFYTTRPTGSGLGLAVVRAIVEAHGGTIGISSSSSGTTCTVTLPLRGDMS